jgi:DNA-binding MurR/RpiR family transcriptional regulator
LNRDFRQTAKRENQLNEIPAQPQTYESLREAVLEEHRRLPKRIAQVATYAIDNPDEIAFGTVASIAASSGVPPSTLVRFAQHLGFDGFTSLQAVFRTRLRERTVSYDERLVALRAGPDDDGSRHILDGYVAASVQSLENLLVRADGARLSRAVDILANAETIYIIARRRSYPVASSVAYALGKLRIPYRLIDSAAGLDADVLELATPRDAALTVSFSPYAAATVDDVRLLARAKTPIIAITDSVFSPLTEFASEWFEVPEADHAGFRSLAATMALAMTLVISVGKARQG